FLGLAACISGGCPNPRELRLWRYTHAECARWAGIEAARAERRIRRHPLRPFCPIRRPPLGSSNRLDVSRIAGRPAAGNTLLRRLQGSNSPADGGNLRTVRCRTGPLPARPVRLRQAGPRLVQRESRGCGQSPWAGARANRTRPGVPRGTGIGGTSGRRSPPPLYAPATNRGPERVGGRPCPSLRSTGATGIGASP